MLRGAARHAVRAADRVLRVASNFLRARLEAWFAADVVRTTVSGFAIEIYDHDLAVEVATSRMDAALQLIARCDALRFKQARRVIPRFVLTRLGRPGAYGAYLPLSGTCYLDARFLATRTAAEVACVIVHESTHARLDRHGFAVFGRNRRIERRCVLEEIAFANRLHPDDCAGLEAWNEGRHRTLAALSKAR